MTKPVWSDYFYADESSPTGLRYKVHRLGGFDIVMKYPGEAAGHASSSGYWNVSIVVDGKNWQRMAHLILWELVYGYEPAEVDHKDGNGLNNKLDNLRDVSRAINMRNRKSCGRKSIDAPMGVFLSEKTNRHGKTYRYWVAGWYPETNSYSCKRFSVAKLGFEEAKAAAISFRKEKMDEIKADLGYTDRHGARDD